MCFEFERVTLSWPHRDPFLPDGEAEAADRQDDVPEERRAADGVDQSVVYEEPLDGFRAWQKTRQKLNFCTTHMWPQNQSIFRNWDLYIIWELNK